MREKATDEKMNIILSDDETRKLIERLVKKVREKDLRVTHLINAISKVWNIEKGKCSDENEFQITQKEKVFMGKAAKFIIHYKKDLTSFFERNKGNGNSQNPEKRIKDFYYFVCAGFLNLEREKKITQSRVEYYLKRGLKQKYCEISLDEIFNFVYQSLIFESEKNIPKFSHKYVSVKNGIGYMSGFKKFKDNQAYNSKVQKTLLGAIWLIKTYF